MIFHLFPKQYANKTTIKHLIEGLLRSGELFQRLGARFSDIPGIAAPYICQ